MNFCVRLLVVTQVHFCFPVLAGWVIIAATRPRTGRVPVSPLKEISVWLMAL
jgi:hypothetical protein